jgi:hypothetical protein
MPASFFNTGGTLVKVQESNSLQFRLRRVLPVLAVLLLLGSAGAWFSGMMPFQNGKAPENSILVIAPYRYQGTWVFDDERLGLVREAFVAGIPEMIDMLVADIPDAEHGFRLTFSARPYPGYEKKLTWVRGDMEGNYYRLDDSPMEGWLCPALFKFYNKAPAELYVKADPR